jgi:hypothetical protein
LRTRENMKTYPAVIAMQHNYARIDVLLGEAVRV